MSAFTIIEVDKMTIRIGDVIEHNGKHQTVGRVDIRVNPFHGRTIFGDSYHSGYKKVKKVIYKNKKGAL